MTERELNLCGYFVIVTSDKMTAKEAIKELEKIEMTRQTDNIYRLDHAVTANQKKILNAFDLTEKNIEYRAAWISEE